MIGWVAIQRIQVKRRPVDRRVLDIARHLDSGGTVPPIHLARLADGNFVVCDGRHRLQAYKLIGWSYVLARYSRREQQ